MTLSAIVKITLIFMLAFLKIGKSNWQNLMKWFGPLFMYIFIAAYQVITLLLSTQFCKKKFANVPKQELISCMFFLV